MKRKAIILLLVLSITTVFVVACGNKTTDNIKDNTENEVVETGTEETVTENSDDGAGQAVNDEGYKSEEKLSKEEAALKEMNETAKFGESLPGEGTGMKKFQDWAKSQGADWASGWTFIYENGSAAGDKESYAVYMKPDSPLYGTVYHIGDELPDGSTFYGTPEEQDLYKMKQSDEQYIESGNLIIDPETGERKYSF